MIVGRRATAWGLWLRRFNPMGAPQLQDEDHQNLQIGHPVGEHDGSRVPQESVDEPQTDSGAEKREHQSGERMTPGTPGANYLRQKGDGRQGPRTVADHLGLIV